MTVHELGEASKASQGAQEVDFWKTVSRVVVGNHGFSLLQGNNLTR